MNERKAQYNDEITSLSAISEDEIKGYSTSGLLLFIYNGKLITDIAKETQWKE